MGSRIHVRMVYIRHTRIQSACHLRRPSNILAVRVEACNSECNGGGCPPIKGRRHFRATQARGRIAARKNYRDSQRLAESRLGAGTRFHRGKSAHAVPDRRLFMNSEPALISFCPQMALFPFLYVYPRICLCGVCMIRLRTNP